MIFDHTRKITHDLQLLIREPIAPFFFFIHPLVYAYKLNGDLLFFFPFEKRFSVSYEAMDTLDITTSTTHVFCS